MRDGLAGRDSFADDQDTFQPKFRTDAGTCLTTDDHRLDFGQVAFEEVGELFVK
jgi:hypothetical protein